MANARYTKARTRFARGDIVWKAAGGDTIRAFLINSALYTPDLANDEFLSDIPVLSRAGNLGGTARGNAPALTLLDPDEGYVKSQDVTFTAIPGGTTLSLLLIFKDDGLADASSPLIALIDNGAGIPVTTNGTDIEIKWVLNRIFRV